MGVEQELNASLFGSLGHLRNIALRSVSRLEAMEHPLGTQVGVHLTEKHTMFHKPVQILSGAMHHVIVPNAAHAILPLVHLLPHEHAGAHFDVFGLLHR